MKIGVKTYNDEKFLDNFINKADFFEVQAIQKYNYDFLKKYKKLEIPFVIHAEHIAFGINLADKSIEKENLKSINFAIKLADMTNAKKIIIHPGYISNKYCSKEQSINFFKKLKDKRILVENLHSLGNRLCQTPKKTKEFLKKTKRNFIFDLSHAIAVANTIKLNKEKTIKDFLELNPKHFHLGGQNWDSDNDQHNSFKEVKLPYKKILAWYPKNAEITLEVTGDIKKTEYDLEFIRKITKELE
jgi:hypothetical protein